MPRVSPSRDPPIKKTKNKQGKDEVFMKNNKLPYEEAELEVVLFSSNDIVTVSGGDGAEPDYDPSNFDNSEDAWV